MQTENLLSANTPETGKLWFWFSFFVTSIFLGQYLYEPFFLPVFIDAFTFTLIVVYFQMRCSAIFELAASDTPLSWSSTLALFSSQLGFDRPLQNKLRIDETYKYMQPRLQVRHMWSKIQESMRTKVPPLPSGSAETGFQGFYGSAISAFTSAFVFLGIHVSQSRIEEHRSQQAERHHKETLAEIQQNNKETLAQNESKIQLEANRIRFEKLGELSNELDVRIDSLVEKIRKLGNTRGADPLKMQYSQDLMIARAKKERTDFERESIYLSEKIQLQGSYSSISDIKPPTVYSVLEPKLKGSEPMQAECLTEASYLGLFF
uniref:Uncharacterized protein n=1 Tax=Zygnema circumcarinatum TaxID=35869 RepID=A0A6N0GXJ8_ZYGCR|nr:hypothetical protein P8547_mgp29 [Zygnema circumcarinatum]QKQ14711.1 hypothetical protein [Zygnema circumcarinatum]WEL36354.1 hypothetical protein [Zygnema circumcarinatum]